MFTPTSKQLTLHSHLDLGHQNITTVYLCTGDLRSYSNHNFRINMVIANPSVCVYFSCKVESLEKMQEYAFTSCWHTRKQLEPSEKVNSAVYFDM